MGGGGVPEPCSTVEGKPPGSVQPRADSMQPAPQYVGPNIRVASLEAYPPRQQACRLPKRVGPCPWVPDADVLYPAACFEKMRYFPSLEAMQKLPFVLAIAACACLVRVESYAYEGPFTAQILCQAAGCGGSPYTC